MTVAIALRSLISPETTVAAGHRIAQSVSRELSHHLTHLDLATIHVEPPDASCGNRHVHDADACRSDGAV